MVISADHVGNSHVMIIDNDSQHVGRTAVRAQQYHIIHLAIERDSALYEVVHLMRLDIARSQPDRTVIVIRFPLPEKLLDNRAMPIGIVGLVDNGPIPDQPQPRQIAEDHIERILRGPNDVSILDSELEVAAVVLGKQPIEQCRPCSTDVEIARRRWSKADYWGCHGADFRFGMGGGSRTPMDCSGGT